MDCIICWSTMLTFLYHYKHILYSCTGEQHILRVHNTYILITTVPLLQRNQLFKQPIQRAWCTLSLFGSIQPTGTACSLRQAETNQGVQKYWTRERVKPSVNKRSIFYCFIFVNRGNLNYVQHEPMFLAFYWLSYKCASFKKLQLLSYNILNYINRVKARAQRILAKSS